jgi:hypothetical protein
MKKKATPYIPPWVAVFVTCDLVALHLPPQENIVGGVDVSKVAHASMPE